MSASRRAQGAFSPMRGPPSHCVQSGESDVRTHPNTMDFTLTHLIDSLQSTLKALKGDANAELMAELHDSDKLPGKKMAGLASTAIDLLHETRQLLEPASLILADHFLGYVDSKCLTAAVELGIPDILRKGPKGLDDLAIECNARSDRLRQVMRVLCNNGIFSFDSASGNYQNNTTSALLLSDHWTQWRNWVDLYGNEFYDMARGIPASCKTDALRTPAQIHFDTDLDMFTYFTNQGWLLRLHKTLSGGAIAQAPGILEDYPWSEIEGTTFLDIGGGTGGLVALVLRKYKNIRAGILDLPKVIVDARENFHSPDGQFYDIGAQVDENNLIAGDFLVEIPRFEVYTMKWCLHDWNDLKALKILSNIRASIIKRPRSRLVIFESLLTDGCSGRLSRYGDITMMISANGQERDESQWRALAQRSGWVVNKMYPLRNCWPYAIELVPSCNAAEAGQTAGGRSFTSQLSFLEPWNASHGEPFIRSAPDQGFESTNIKWINHPVVINDARPRRNEFNLDREGFAFFDDPEGLKPEVLYALRSNDRETIKNTYFLQIERIVKRSTGASRVITFDSTMRRKNPSMDPTENPNGAEQPATMVHCDQSARGAICRLHQNVPDAEEFSTLLQKRIKLINVWRPLRGPVDNWPLALMDYQSLAMSNVHPCNLWRHQFEDRGQTVAISHADRQRWYYLDGHAVDEVTMIKIWDNDDRVEGKFCPHAAFEHPSSTSDAIPRESVEVRCFAIWD